MATFTKKNRKSMIRLGAVALILAAILVLELNNKKNSANRGAVETTSLSQSGTDVGQDEDLVSAKEIVAPSGFINTENNKPITLSEYIGDKVILVDFWTYSCINCQRTLPHLNAWHETYANDGLLIVGIHRPEFEFEKDIENVQAAVDKWDIKYPVVLDNDAGTWRAYENRYWPRKYIINLDGNIVYDHIGEGAYEETETIIKNLLNERSERLGLESKMKDSDTLTSSEIKTTKHSGERTPELYLGSAREELRYSKSIKNISDLPIHHYTLGENTSYAAEYARVSSGESLELRFYAKDVHLVTEAPEPVKADIYLDNELLKTHTFTESDLSTLVELEEAGEHTLRIDFKDEIDVYAFTFG